MCMNDWRIGRLIRTNVHPVSANGNDLIVLPNSQRVGISFSLDTLNAVDNTSRALVEVDSRMVAILSISQPYCIFTLLTHGDLPTKKWIVDNGAFPEGVGITEYFMPEEYLAAGLDQFNSEYSRWNPQNSRQNSPSSYVPPPVI